ncbi:fasciclin domain-containing protein [Alteriqipengyuania sp. 357]
MKFRVPMLPLAVAFALAACAPSLGDDVNLENVAPDDIAWLGETPIYPNATIAENIAAADTFSHLAVLVERTGLAGQLGGEGPYTIFAPTDAAFAQVPTALRDELARPENAQKLRDIVAGHVIPGTITAAELAARIETGGGAYRAQSLAGGMLTFSRQGDAIVIASPGSQAVTVTMADLTQANGMMHVIDGVVLP